MCVHIFHSSHVLDSKSQSRYGVYVSKEKLRSFKTNKITVSSEKGMLNFVHLCMSLDSSGNILRQTVNVCRNRRTTIAGVENC